MEIKRCFALIQIQILCCLVLLQPAAAQNSPQKNKYATVTYEMTEHEGKVSFFQVFSWQPDEYALSYELEIQDAAGSIRSFSTEKNMIRLSLPPGIFQYRIRVYDLLGRYASATDWQRFEILRAVQPFITGIEKAPALLPGKAETELVLNAQGVTTESTVSLISEKTGEIIPCSILEITDTRVRIAFSSDKAAPGSYTVRIQNPAGLESSETGISLTAAVAPRILTVEPSKFILKPGEPVRAAVTAKGLSAESKAEFISKDGTVRIPAELNFGGISSGTEFAIASSPGKTVPAEVTVPLNGTDLSPGEWQLFISNPGGLTDVSAMMEIERTFQPEITSIEPAQQVLLAGEPVSVTLSGSGFFERSAFLLTCTDDVAKPGAKPQDAVTLAPISSAVQNDSARLEFPTLPESFAGGTYTVTVQNPRDLTDNSVPVPIRFAVQPVFVSEPEGQYYIIEGEPLLIPLTVRDVQESHSIELVSSDGTERIAAAVRFRTAEKGGSEELSLAFDASPVSEKSYFIEIAGDRGLTAASRQFSLIETAHPDIAQAQTHAEVLHQGTSFTVDFTGSGFVARTQLYLVPRKTNLLKKKLPRSAIPASSAAFDGTGGTAVFNSMLLKDTEYMLAAENPGSLRDSAGRMVFTIINKTDITVRTDLGPSFRLYNEDLSQYHIPFNSKMLQFSLSCIQTKKSYGYFGAEFTGQYRTWLHKTNTYDVQNHMGLMHFTILYQYPFFNEQLRLGVKAGIGAAMLSRVVSDTQAAAADGTDSGLTALASFSGGLDVTFFPVHHVFFSAGADFVHLFGSSAFAGFITPRLGAGIRF